MGHFNEELKDGELFKVFLIFPDGGSHLEASHLDIESAVKLAYDHSNRPAAKIGITQEIRIVDGGDNTVFQWKFGEGVVFPKREET